MRFWQKTATTRCCGWRAKTLKGYALPSQTALVAQLGPHISEELYAAPDEEVSRRTITLVSDC
jgi:hypothetical protein